MNIQEGERMGIHKNGMGIHIHTLHSRLLDQHPLIFFLGSVLQGHIHYNQDRIHQRMGEQHEHKLQHMDMHHKPTMVWHLLQLLVRSQQISFPSSGLQGHIHYNQDRIHQHMGKQHGHMWQRMDIRHKPAMVWLQLQSRGLRRRWQRIERLPI